MPTKSNPQSVLPTINEIIVYLQKSGWKRDPISNALWDVYTNDNIRDIHYDPIEIVFPRNHKVADAASYIISALELLADINHQPLSDLQQHIAHPSRDILRIRNVTTKNTISLDIANSHITRLHQLFSFAASVETDPRPFYHQANPSAAKRVLDLYQFGHTFKGSFGFTVEAPIADDRFTFTQQSLFARDEDEQPLSIAPFGRRVLERVMRGLTHLKRVEQTQIPTYIVEHYGSGLNANMCRALIGMTRRYQTLEWSVEWSPSLAPADDVAYMEPVIVSPDSQSYLRAAIDQLQEWEPEEQWLEGHVVGFHSDDNPQISGFLNRSIVLRWENRPNNRPLRVIIVLNKDDYLNATEAHMQWKRVAVRGIVQYVGSAWRLLQSHNFQVIEV